MDKILQPRSAEEMIASAATAIDALKTASGYQKQHFDALCMPVIKHFASCVQSIPLAKTQYGHENGAWEFGLYASMIALRVAGSNIFFPDIQSEERRKMEPQCRFAAFAATLATTIALVSQNSRVYVKHDGGEDEYHALVATEDLHSWLLRSEEARFNWRTNYPKLTNSECAAIASKFLPTAVLAKFDLRIVMMIFNSISPQVIASGVESTLSKVVRTSISKVLEKFEQDQAKLYKGEERPSQTIDFGSILIDAPSVPGPASTAVSTAPTEKPNAESIEITRSTLMSNANQTLVTWFEVLKEHKHYSQLKERIVVTEVGIEVPVSMLGLFGVNAPMIKKLMTDANMVIDRTADAKGLILHPALKSMLLTEEETQ